MLESLCSLFTRTHTAFLSLPQFFFCPNTPQTGQDSVGFSPKLTNGSCKPLGSHRPTVGSHRSLSPSAPSLAAPEAPCQGQGVPFDKSDENNDDKQNRLKLRGSCGKGEKKCRELGHFRIHSFAPSLKMFFFFLLNYV